MNNDLIAFISDLDFKATAVRVFSNQTSALVDTINWQTFGMRFSNLPTSFHAASMLRPGGENFLLSRIIHSRIAPRQDGKHSILAAGIIENVERHDYGYFP